MFYSKEGGHTSSEADTQHHEERTWGELESITKFGDSHEEDIVDYIYG